MKQLDTLQKKKERQLPDRKRWRLWSIILSILFIGNTWGYAQIYWAGNGVSTATETFSVAGDAGFLDIAFSTDGLTNGKVKVNLPPNFKYDGLTTGGSYTPVSNENENGQDVTLTFGSVLSGTNVTLQLKVLALKGAENESAAKIVTTQVLDGDSQVGSDATLEISAAIPMLQIVPKENSISYGAETETHTYEVNLSAQKADVNKFTVHLATSKEVTLSKLMVGTKELEIAGGDYSLDQTTSATLDYYVIPFTNSLMGGVLAKDGTIKLKFDAKSILPKTSTITVEAKYPNFTTTYASAISQTLTMQFQPVGGNPVIKFNGYRYTKEAKTSASTLASSDIPLDITTVYWETTYTNTGTADAYRIKWSQTFAGIYSFIDQSNLYYQIEGEAEPTQITSEYINKSNALLRNRLPNALSIYADEVYNLTGSLPLEKSIPVGKKITFWVGFKTGEVYNNKDLNRYTNIYMQILAGGAHNITSCESASGAAGVPSTNATSAQLGLPYWREIPAAYTFNGAGDEWEQKVWMGANGILSGSTFDVKIDMPEWLELDDSYAGFGWTDLHEDPSTLTPPQNNDFATTRIFKFNGFSASTGVTMHFKFKVKNGSYSGNQTGQVIYRITYYGKTSSDELENTSQVVQPVFLSVKHTDVQLNTFKLIRTSRGDIDTDNNGVSDNGTKAGENDNIVHTTYVEGDKGKFVWEGNLGKAQTGAIFMANLLHAHTLGMFSFGTPTISFDGGSTSTNIDLAKNANNKDFLVKYTGSWNAGDNYRIELPFTVLSGSDLISMVESKAYISTNASAVPTFNNAEGCSGLDQKGSRIQLVPLDFEIRMNDAHSLTFNSNVISNARRGTVKTFFNDKFVAPYFKGEARCVRYPETFIWNLPVGYALAQDTIYLTFQLLGKKPNAPTYGARVKGEEKINNDGTRQYTFKLGTLFDLDQQDDINSGQPAVGKTFPFPDDQWQMHVNAGLYASKNAQTSATATRTFILNTPDGLPIEMTETVTYLYGGQTIDLSAEKEITIAGNKTTTPITVSNPNTYNSNIWVYVDGPVKDIQLGSKDGAPAATALSNQWFSLGELAKNKDVNYNLSFTHNEASRKDFKVTVYTVSNFDDSWTGPSGTEEILDIDDGYRGRNREITVKPQPSSLEGVITIASGNSPAELIQHQEAYQLTATINSANSRGSSINAVMSIRIPEGQKFVADNLSQKATVSYGGTTYDITSALKSQLEDSEAARTVEFILSDYITDGLMVGSEGITSSDISKQQAVLTAWFTPECDTKFERFSATLLATDVYGTSLTGKVTDSKQLISNTDIGYSFEGAFTGTKPSFSDVSDTRTLTFTLTKKGPNEVDATSYVQLVIPSILDVVSTGIKVNSTDLNLTDEAITVKGNAPDNATGLRTVQLALPFSAYSAISANGQGAVVTYSIPVTYTAPAESTDPASVYQSLLANPVKAMDVSVMGFATFGTCQGQTATPIGTFSSEAAFVITNGTKSAPVKAFVKDQAELKVLTSGFSGTFLIGSGSAQSTGIYTPSATTYTDATSGIADGILEEVIVNVKYGINEFEPVKAYFKVYPSLIFALDEILDRSFCGDESVTLDDYIDDTSKSTHTTITFYSDEQCQQTVNSSNAITISQNITYYAKASNNGGDGGKEPTALAFTRKSMITFNPDVPGAPIVTSEGLPLTITVDATGASSLTYQWYKDGQPISGATSATFNKTAAISDAGSYYVVVSSDGSMDNICNNISGTVVVQVLPTPADVMLENADLSYCGTEINDKFLWNQIVSPDNALTYYYNTDGSSSYTSEVSAGSKVQLAAGTYYLKAKNSAGGYSTQATIFTVANPTPVSITSVKDLINSREAGVTAGIWYYNHEETIELTVSAAGTPVEGQTALAYELYNGSSLVTSSANGVLTISSPTSSANGTYTVKVTGACGPLESDPFTIAVCPSVDVSGFSDILTYCETNTDLQTGILLTDLFTEVAGLEYYYNTDGGNTYATLVAGIELPKAPNSVSNGITYYIKAKNEKGTYSSQAAEIKVTVHSKTVITKVDGYEVIEGDAINIVVVAEGEGNLKYDWYEEGNATPLETTDVGTYQITPSSNRGVDDNKIYRVVVRGEGECAQAEQSFRLNVKSRVTPPLGNYRVSWNVIGYGKVEVTADGVSISNGSHVNKGAKLVISATTWKSNALDWVTVNGVKYTSSPITYTVNENNVDIVANFLGSDPNPDDPNSNAEIENVNRIWTEGGYACIHTETATRVRIVTFNGRVQVQQNLPAGESRIQLPDGYYIVTLSDGTTKKIAIRNF